MKKLMKFLKENAPNVEIMIGETIHPQAAAQFDPSKKLITIKPEFQKSRKALAHEIAHAVAWERWKDPTHRKFGYLGLLMGQDLFAHAQGHKTVRAIKLIVKKKK